MENADRVYYCAYTISIHRENSTITSPFNILFLTAVDSSSTRSRPLHIRTYLYYIIIHHPAATLQYAHVVPLRIGTNNRARRWRRRLSDKDTVIVIAIVVIVIA